MRSFVASFLLVLFITTSSIANWLVVPGPQPSRLSGGSGVVTASENFSAPPMTNLDSIDLTGDWVHSNNPSSAYADARSVSNQVVGTSSRKSQAYWSSDTFGANQKACMTVKTVGTGGPSVRINTTAATGLTGYFVSLSGGNYTLEKGDGGGTSTVLATYSASSTDDVVCISATGTTLTVSVNSSDETPYNDSSSPYTTGQPGLYCSSNTYYGDDWSATEL